MRVNEFLLETFFTSESGKELQLGFETILSHYDYCRSRDAGEGGDEVESGAPPPEEDDAEEDNEGPDSYSTTKRIFRAAAFAFFTVFNLRSARFRGVWPAALRRLRSTGPITNEAAARDVFWGLLDQGIEITRADVGEHDEFVEAVLLSAETDEQDSMEDAAPVVGEDAREPSATQEETAPDEVVLRLGQGEESGEKSWLSSIGELSWGLYVRYPQWFVPYGFVHRYHHFEAICAEFKIPLKKLPPQLDYRARAEHYLEINEALQEFRRNLGLDPGSFAAFLYGFAANYVRVADVEEPPPPERAWLLLGHSRGDYEWLEEADQDSESHWQGSDGIRPGDICVMWVRSPHSCTHSVWRAISAGYPDPFFTHYRTVWIGHPTAVPRVRFRELKANPIWSKKPEVRSHFQGASGREITLEEYDELLRLWTTKGGDLSTLPRIIKPKSVDLGAVENERDVETKLLEPLLQRLGYSHDTWVRQYPVRMGRGERNYPDYAIGLTGKYGEEVARVLVEAKHRISGRRLLHDAYLQARSYAERLRANTIILCSLEGLWVYPRTGGQFSADRFETFTWAGLSEPGPFDALRQMIGEARD